MFLTALTAAFILLQTVSAQPSASSAPQSDELRIVSVEQTGKPPFTPEGRIYRLEGEPLSRIKPGEILILKRLKDDRVIGSLRVLTVQSGSATASLEVRGDTFPLKGDLAYPLGSLGIPDISSMEAKHLKDDFAFPLNPPVIPPLPRPDIGTVGQNITGKPSDSGARSTGNSSSPPQAAAKESGVPLASQLLQESAIKPPDAPRTLDDIIASHIAEAEAAAQKDQDDAEQAVALPKIVAQNPFYFLPESAELSLRGIEKLQQWVEEWGKKDVRYFLAVPEKHIKLQKLLVDRLAGLQRELSRLGVVSTGIRTDDRNLHEPFDTIYVCVETDVR